MLNLEDIALKMVKSKFEAVPNRKGKLIHSIDETFNFPKLIEELLNEGNPNEYDENQKYVIFRAYFDRKNKECKKERDQIVIMTDESKENVIFACINIIKDCCTNEHEFIGFNINRK